MRARGFVTLAKASTQDLFDQKTAFGRLALVHVIMMAGDTLVTVSLDRSANGRRLLVAFSAVVRAVLCVLMAQHLNSLWLFPLAFFLLVSSKLYVVTRGALVPEMARTDQFREHGAHVGDAGWPNQKTDDEKGFAGFNAQLTLLGTLSGLVAGSVGAGILKGISATAVLVVASFVYLGATVASARLQRPTQVVLDEVVGLTQEERDRNALNPLGDSDVAWGLGAAAIMRFAAGFATFLLAFGLRRESAGLGWYAFALGLSGIGSLGGLAFVTRMRNVLKEATLLTIALFATGVGAAFASLHPVLVVQVLLAGWIGVSGAVAQPSFDAITQRNVAPGAQGRTFARFAVRQQLLWVIGALIPVAIVLSFGVGDRLLAVLMLIAAAVYPIGRHSAREDSA